MRIAWWALVAVGCYQAPALDTSSCTLRCEQQCPDGTSCVNGYCVAPGEVCGDAGIPPANACITEVALGRGHTCVVKQDGSVWCTGDNESGQLGNGAQGEPRASAVQALDASGPIGDATSVAAGRDHSCAIRPGGTVWCWGDGGDGRLGNNVASTSSLAVQVQTGAGPLTGIVELALGSRHSCARDEGGAVWCWGRNSSGQVGDNSLTQRNTAVQVLTTSLQPLTGAVDLTAGRDFACVRTNAEPWCWGDNSDGVLGDGAETDRPAAAASPMIGSPAQLEAGAFHICSLTGDAVSCWGDSWHRRLGNPRYEDLLMPTPVEASLDGTPFTGVAQIAVASISCARMLDGRVLCWGNNVHGQHGSGGGSFLPAEVTLPDGRTLTGITKLSAGYAHVCAFRDDGMLLCWGRGTEGQFGTGSFENLAHPSPLGITCP